MNNKMSDLLYCEFFKLNRKRTFLKLVIAIVVIALAIMGISALFKGLFGVLSLSSGVTNYDAQIASLKEEMAAIEKIGGWTDKLIIGNALDKYKAKIAVIEYLKSHNIPQGSTMMYSSSGTQGILGFDVFSFTQLTMGTLMSIIFIFLIVACCKTTNGEYTSGAMKMQLMQPISKNKFFTAKWLSIVIASEVLTVGSFLLSLILGLILYGPNALDVAFVAGSAVTIVSPMGAMIINLLLYMVQVFAYTALTMFICSVCKTYGRSIVLALLLIVFSFGEYIELFLAIPYVGYLGFFANADWASGISVDGTTFKGMTVWAMIPITLLWCAFFMWFSYRKFNKREC